MTSIRRVNLVLALAAAVLCLPLLAGLHCGDLPVYQAGGRAVLGARPLYDVRVGDLGFTYPPFAALLCVPLGLLSLGAATLVMALASLGSLAVVLRHSAGDLMRRASLPALAGVFLLATCEPVRSTFWSGQVDLVLAALVLSDLQGRRWGGRAVGLAAAIKLTPAIFVVYLLIRGRRREARNAVITFAAVTAGTAVVLPGESWRYWTRDVFAGSGIGHPAHNANQSLFGILLRDAGPHLGPLLWALLAVPVAVVGVRTGARLAASGRENYGLGVVGITGCLVSPVAWTHHWVWCIPLLVGLAASVSGQGRLRVGGVAVVAAVFALAEVGPLTVRPHAPFSVVSGHLFVGAVLLAIACTRGGRVLNRNWHSTRVSASRNSEARGSAGRPSRALAPALSRRVHPRE